MKRLQLREIKERINDREHSLFQVQGGTKLVTNSAEEFGPDGGSGRSKAPVGPCSGGVRGVKPGGGPGSNLLEPGCRSVRLCEEGTVDKVSPSQVEQCYGVRSAPGPSFALFVLTRFTFF